MYRHFKFSTTIFLLLASAAFIASCSNNEQKEPTPDSNTTVTPPVAAFITPGILDTLYIRREAFDTINNGSRLQFSFVFKNPDTLTLHGWLFKPGGGPGHKQFDSLPNIKLLKGRPSGLTYGPRTYFSGVSFTPTEYNKLKSALTASTRYVLFAPYIYGSAIGYKVFISNDDFSAASGTGIYAIDPTGADLNPSPPKDY